ncbi:MAG: O-antigen ligase family protein [Candidatus Beckwithbacteria bacterium]
MDFNKSLNKLIAWSFYLLLIIVPLILTPYNYELFEFNKLLTVYFLTLIISGAWVIKMLYQKKLIFTKTPFDLPLLLFLISQIVSTIFSIDPHTSVWGYYSRFHGGLLSTLSYITLYYAFVSNFSADKKIVNNCFKVILSTAAVVAGYAVLEHFGIDKTIWIQDVQNRVFSTLGQPNWLAAYLLTIIPLALAFSLKRPVRFLYPILFFITLLFTKSRSGFLGLAVSLLIFFILNLKTKKLYLLLAGLGLTALIIGTPFTPSLSQLLTNSFQPSQSIGLAQDLPASQAGGSKSSDIRKVVWQGAVDIWKHYPFFGSGVETFAYSYYNFRPQAHNLLSEWDFLYNKAHNEFLNFLATTGIFGLTAYCLIILAFIVWTLKHLQTNRLIFSALLAGYSGLAVSNFLGFSVVPVALFFWLFPAFAVTLSQPEPKLNSKNTYYFFSSPQKQISFLVIIITTILLYQVINLWRADYHFNQGRNLIKVNQISSGFSQLKTAVDLSPHEPLFRSEYAEVLAKLAYLYHDADQSSLSSQLATESLLQTNQVLAANSVHLNYYKSKLKILLILANIDPNYTLQALETIIQAIKLSPTDAKLYYNLSLIYQQLNQTELAKQTLIQTIDLKPNYEAARFSLGSLYQQLNETNLARAQFEYILQYLNPENEEAKKAL